MGCMEVVELCIFLQNNQDKAPEFIQVKKIAEEFQTYLNQNDVIEKIRGVNAPNHSSHDVQKIFLDFLSERGFQDEKKGLFSNYKTALLRLDYYEPIVETGIIFEVECGKTIMNNMDLLDLWKCRICPYADYLFFWLFQKR